MVLLSCGCTNERYVEIELKKLEIGREPSNEEVIRLVKLLARPGVSTKTQERCWAFLDSHATTNLLKNCITNGLSTTQTSEEFMFLIKAIIVLEASISSSEETDLPENGLDTWTNSTQKTKVIDAWVEWGERF